MDTHAKKRSGSIKFIFIAVSNEILRFVSKTNRGGCQCPASMSSVNVQRQCYLLHCEIIVSEIK